MRGSHRPSFVSCAALAATLDGWSHCEFVRLPQPRGSPRSWKGFVSWARGTGEPPQTHVSGHYILTHSLSETMVLHLGSHVSFQKHPRWRLKREAGRGRGCLCIHCHLREAFWFMNHGRPSAGFEINFMGHTQNFLNNKNNSEIKHQNPWHFARYCFVQILF